jgi:excisionase family DNA binding protein
MEIITLPPLVHSPDSAALRIGKSVRSIYELIDAGELKSYKDGKRRLIPDTELVAYVDRCMKKEHGDGSR